MKTPSIEVNITISGAVEKWGLGCEQGGVSICKLQNGKWEEFFWVPNEIAIHVGPIAAADIAFSQAIDVAHMVMDDPEGDGSEEDIVSGVVN